VPEIALHYTSVEIAGEIALDEGSQDRNQLRALQRCQRRNTCIGA
jgi:hypothetical protein